MEHVDVVVVGAGISGIAAAYRLQTQCPDLTFAVLEARERLGGTWDLFRYPGARSDSDMHTLSFPFAPWRGQDAIADGEDILDYLTSVARHHGIEQKVRFGHRVTALDWSSGEARWTVTVQRQRQGEGEGDGPQQVTLTAGYVYLCSGYYDHDRPHDAGFAGMQDFAGLVVHPQFWPDGLEVADHRVVVIGSGATAMTLVPALAERGARVTMLQRTPTYVLSRPRREGALRRVADRLPGDRGPRLMRATNAGLNAALYRAARTRPALVRKVLQGGVTRQLGAEATREHFTPPYDPWDQRLCVVPDNDLFRAVAAGTATVVTDTVERFTAEGVLTGSGRQIEADIIVTATGLQVRVDAGAQIRVDGELRRTRDVLLYRGMLMGGIPNLAVCIGYINASWTLRADLSSRYLCRLLNHMRDNGFRVATPQPRVGMGRAPLLPISAGYVQRAADVLPRQGTQSPWLMRQSYRPDRAEMLYGDVTDDMVFG